MTSYTRILGLDLGAKRIGLALSDALGLTAQGLTVLQRRGGERDLDQVVELAGKHEVQEIVLGLPRHLDGRLGDAAVEVLAWAEALRERLGIPVHTWDERLTTLQAERVLIQADVSRRKRRLVIDKLAAVLILQAFLDARREAALNSCSEPLPSH
ncbi:MAG: Holliday junction resolvase RuvX [Deltaproteobacteria bacterium]|nr:Holliday junction resolvase RuvX [Deltaproteobacteria bacterium]